MQAMKAWSSFNMQSYCGYAVNVLSIGPSRMITVYDGAVTNALRLTNVFELSNVIEPTSFLQVPVVERQQQACQAAYV